MSLYTADGVFIIRQDGITTTELSNVALSLKNYIKQNQLL